MAGSKKSKKVTQPESDEENNEAVTEFTAISTTMEIQATFEGRNLEGQDFYGIKQLLNQLFLTAHIDLSQMTDILIAQTGIGSVLKQSCNDSDDEEDIDMVDESDVFGISSVVNLSQHKETPCVQQLYKFIDEELKKCSDSSIQTEFKNILDSSNKIGLLINERFINIPAKISYPMLNALAGEIQRMIKKNDGYNFDYYLMISKVWKAKGNASDDLIFSNEEEEIFHNSCDCSFTYSVASKSDTGLTGKWKSGDTELLPYRVVILFKADKFSNILDAVQPFVAN